MPALAVPRLSLQDFHARHDGEKPYFEYWDGEAIQKTAPTRLHGLIEGLLVRLLDALGFDPGSEITLKLDSAYQPIPDVIAAEGQLGDPYPTEPFEVVVEILSPEDSFSRGLRKCRLYEKWGIKQIVVIDPQERLIWRFEDGSARETDVIARRGDRVIAAQELWMEVDRLLRSTNAQSTNTQ